MAVTKLDLDKLSSPALVVFYDDQKKLLSKATPGELLDQVKASIALDFKGRYKEAKVFYTSKDAKVSRVIAIGTGKLTDLNFYKLKALAAVVSKVSSDLGLDEVTVAIPTLPKLKASDATYAFELGRLLTQFDMSECRSKKDEKKKTVFTYLVADSKDLKGVSASVEKAGTVGRGVNWSRRLIMLPPITIYPDSFVEEVKKMVAELPQKIKATYWGEKELKAHGYGGILGVGQGSDQESRFIVLEYSGAAKSKEPLVLVGKGVTFDSGGLSLKPPSGQETMKYDMAGAASVMGAFKIAVELGIKANLVAITPLVENLPSGKAIKPGDILKMASGKTVEVLNTDAEGRLILADALFHATTKFKPAAVVDVATLTGACANMVGEAAAGVFSNQSKVLKSLVDAGNAVSENIFPVPDYEDFYGDKMKSDIADLRNMSLIREAGTSTASIFLREFVHNNTPWAHLDIAGCGWYDSPRDFIANKGASGVPIQTLVQWVEDYK